MLLNRILGAILGSILFPVRSLLTNATLLVWSLLEPVAFYIGILLAVIFELAKSSNFFSDLVRSTFTVIGMILIAIPVVVVALAVGLYYSVTDTFMSMYKGLDFGFRNGILATLAVLFRAPHFIFSSGFSRVIRAHSMRVVGHGLNEEHTPPASSRNN